MTTNEETAAWLTDWLECDMLGDEAAITAFTEALAGHAPAPSRRIGNAYAASVTGDGLVLETLMQDGLTPVTIPADTALAALRRAL